MKYMHKIHTFEQKICIYPSPNVTYNYVIILRNEKI